MKNIYKINFTLFADRDKQNKLKTSHYDPCYGLGLTIENTGKETTHDGIDLIQAESKSQAIDKLNTKWNCYIKINKVDKYIYCEDNNE